MIDVQVRPWREEVRSTRVEVVVVVEGVWRERKEEKTEDWMWLKSKRTGGGEAN